MLRLKWRIAALKNGLQDATAYRIEFLLQLIGSAGVPALIQWLLWYAIFKIGGQTEVAGMSYTDLLAYTWMSVLFSQVRGGDHDFALMEMIRSGGLSNYLLRPVSPVEFVYIRGVAEKLFVAGICLVIGMIASFAVGLNPLHLLGAMILALLGNIIHYQLGAMIATLAFLWEEAYAILMVKNMVVQILSGELIPLNLFPANMQWVWKMTPFYLYVYGPTQFALGRWNLTEFGNAILIACAWIVFFTVGIKVTWKFGIKRYLSLGG